MATSGTPSGWAGPLRELERWEWRSGDPADPVDGLSAFLGSHGLSGEPAGQRGGTAVALLAGAVGAARIGGVPTGRASPVPAVPELVAVALRPVSADPGPAPTGPGSAGVGEWATSWTDGEHAAAVETVRQAIARGDLYQANVVGHRSAPHRGDPREFAAAVAQLSGALYGGVLAGSGWAVGCGSP
nr:anthranilate synthase component I family protein [Actinomycetota bacterium]